ncbi:MAG: HEAT repeat domain-containing protein [Oscillospiraceae bacterium]
MKKLVSLMLAAGMLLSLTSCGESKKGNESKASNESTVKVQELDYANLTEDDLLKSIVKDQQNVTLEEFTELVSTLSNVKITEDMGLEDNITFKAIKKLRDNNANLPEASEYVAPLLKSDSPQVRGYAISNTSSLFGVSDEHVSDIKELLINEKDPYVLCCAVNTLANEGGSDADVGKFLLDMAKHENKYVRKQAAYAIGNSWNKNLNGAVDAIITLMNDSDDDVRDAAYSSAGKLADEKVIEPITAMLKNPDEAKFHSSGIRSLVTLWYDYPFHENTSAAAYKATMDYLKTTPASDKVPAWTAITSFESKSESSFDEWRAKATYYNPDEIAKVMTDLVKNPDVNWLGRTGAIGVVASHCSKEAFDGLGTVVKGLTDDKAQFVQDEYDSQAEELNKQ